MTACSGTLPSNSSTPSTGSTPAGGGSLTINNAAWNYDAEHDVYYQLALSFVAAPAAPEIETLGIYVPGPYFSGTNNGDGTYTVTVNPSGGVNSFTAKTAPIVLPVNTPGYSGQQPLSEYSYDSVADYLTAGFIYVHAGLRGKDTNTEAYSGNAPWGVTDLKAAVRYLRFNAASLPGAMDKVFVFGHSGGGAQSSVMGASGDSPLYTPYLERLGAAMTTPDGAALSDAIAGVMAWCPITSLNHGNSAYEWNMGQFASDGTRAEGTWTAAFSKDLAAAFAAHLNDLKLTDANGTALTLTESSDGVFLAGSYYDYVLAEVNTSLNNFLADTTFPYTPSNTHMAGMEPGGAPPGGSGAPGGGTPPSGEAPGGGGPGASPSESSVTYNTVDEYIASLNSDGEWVVYDAATNTATITSLRDFVVSQKSPSKDVGAFDAPDRSATENIVMGQGAEGRHFSESSRQVLATHESTYQSLTNWSADYAASTWEADFSEIDEVGGTVTGREHMYEPLYYLVQSQAGFGTSQVAPHWRIRTGLKQGDTASTVEINLALALQQLGSASVDFATVWGQGHTMAERTGEATGNFIAWVKESVS